MKIIYLILLTSLVSCCQNQPCQTESNSIDTIIPLDCGNISADSSAIDTTITLNDEPLN